MEEKARLGRKHMFSMENRERGQITADGRIDAIEYSEISSYAKKGESVIARLFK